MIADRLLWPALYKDVHVYVKTCDGCKQMTSIFNYFSGLKTPVTSQFDVLAIDFAESLPVTPQGNEHFLVCVEHLTGWPIVCAAPTTTASEVLKFVEKTSSCLLKCLGSLYPIIGRVLMLGPWTFLRSRIV